MRWYFSSCVFLALFTTSLAPAALAGQTRRPNVILIMTDDQGYGDLGFHGNPKIKTPNLDALAHRSTQLEYFYVSPVCSPTRASLMTGRYNYRTGVVDTHRGRSMMYSDEVTLAEMLSAAGYRTGIFGKWHLGDHFPMRPIEQGFSESLVHNGGGICQPSDPPPGSSYFDPVLQHNGKAVKTKGYCSDIFTDAAIEFITKNRAQPFFVYLPFNCPHTPLQVAERDYMPYMKMNLDPSEFPNIGNGIHGKTPKESIAKIYGMITNIDDNLGRLFAKLEALKLADETIIIFLTDNGPQQSRYNAGLRGLKGSIYEGGIRVPCFVCWPGKIQAGRKIDRIAAHIDITPTLLEACGVKPPTNVSFDGRSIWPLLKGQEVNWPDRTLYFQWHRGDEPEMFRAFAARTQRYKLVREGTPFSEDKTLPESKFELFDIADDPFEMKDIAAQHPEIVADMKAGYQTWFREVSGTRGYAPLRIHIGTLQENPVLLSRQDCRGPREGWQPDSLGHWEIHIAETAGYNITLLFGKIDEPADAHFSLGDIKLQQHVEAPVSQCTFQAIRLPAGPAQLEAWIARPQKNIGVGYVEIKRIE